jgi:hypothetical protein
MITISWFSAISSTTQNILFKVIILSFIACIVAMLVNYITKNKTPSQSWLLYLIILVIFLSTSILLGITYTQNTPLVLGRPL